MDSRPKQYECKTQNSDAEVKPEATYLNPVPTARVDVPIRVKLDTIRNAIVSVCEDAPVLKHLRDGVDVIRISIDKDNFRALDS